MEESIMYPFRLEDALAGAKMIHRNGEKVGDSRFYRRQDPVNTNLIYRLENNGTYTKNGTFFYGQGSLYDLFMVEPPKEEAKKEQPKAYRLKKDNLWWPARTLLNRIGEKYVLHNDGIEYQFTQKQIDEYPEYFEEVTDITWYQAIFTDWDGTSWWSNYSLQDAVELRKVTNLPIYKHTLHPDGTVTVEKVTA